MEIFTAHHIQFHSANQGNFMKYFILFLCFTNITKAKSTDFKCHFEKMTYSFDLSQKNEIDLNIFSGKNKISSCQLKITDSNNGKNSEAITEIYYFKKTNCSIIYDKIASKNEIIEEGYFKKGPFSNKVSAYILKNKQPLSCAIEN